MNLNLINSLFQGKFFQSGRYINHKIVNIISVNDETKTVVVVLQRYTIGRGATVRTNPNNLLTLELPYSEIHKVNR